MTDQTTRLLRDAGNYLSALHGSVARHDNLAANFGCAGCELRDRLAAELAAPTPAGLAPDTDQTPLRTRIAEALAREDAHNWGYDHGFVHVYGGDPETDGFVDAVLAVLPASVDRATVLRELADKAAEWDGHITEQELRRMAAEAGPAAAQPPKDA